MGLCKLRVHDVRQEGKLARLIQTPDLVQQCLHDFRVVAMLEKVVNDVIVFEEFAVYEFDCGVIIAFHRSNQREVVKYKSIERELARVDIALLNGERNSRNLRFFVIKGSMALNSASQEKMCIKIFTTKLNADIHNIVFAWNNLIAKIYIQIELCYPTELSGVLDTYIYNFHNNKTVAIQELQMSVDIQKFARHIRGVKRATIVFSPVKTDYLPLSAICAGCLIAPPVNDAYVSDQILQQSPFFDYVVRDDQLFIEVGSFQKDYSLQNKVSSLICLQLLSMKSLEVRYLLSLSSLSNYINTKDALTQFVNLFGSLNDVSAYLLATSKNVNLNPSKLQESLRKHSELLAKNSFDLEEEALNILIAAKHYIWLERPISKQPAVFTLLKSLQGLKYHPLTLQKIILSNDAERQFAIINNKALQAYASAEKVYLFGRWKALIQALASPGSQKTIIGKQILNAALAYSEVYKGIENHIKECQSEGHSSWSTMCSGFKKIVKAYLNINWVNPVEEAYTVATEFEQFRSALQRCSHKASNIGYKKESIWLQQHEDWSPATSINLFLSNFTLLDRQDLNYYESYQKLIENYGLQQVYGGSYLDAQTKKIKLVAKSTFDLFTNLRDAYCIKGFTAVQKFSLAKQLAGLLADTGFYQEALNLYQSISLVDPMLAIYDVQMHDPTKFQSAVLDKAQCLAAEGLFQECRRFLNRVKARPTTSYQLVAKLNSLIKQFCENQLKPQVANSNQRTIDWDDVTTKIRAKLTDGSQISPPVLTSVPQSWYLA